MPPVKYLFAVLLACLTFTSCTMIPGPHGTAQFWGDYQDIAFQDGSVKFSAKSMVHSGVVRAHWHGAIAVGGEVGTTILGLSAVQPAVKAATTLAPVIPAAVNRPTTRANSTTKP